MISVRSRLQLLNGNKLGMIKAKLIFFIVLFTGIQSLCAQVKSTNIQTINNKKYYIHKIDKGQSLYSISKLYDVKLDDIYTENPELKEGSKAGQEIRIPFSKQDVKAVPVNTVTAIASQTMAPLDTTKFVSYRVSKGETVYSITKRFNLSNDYFNKLNPDAKNGIKEGQLVAIGEKKQKPQATITQTASIDRSPVKPIDTATTKLPAYSKKPAYTVALILPFKLDQMPDIVPSNLVKANMSFPQISSLAVDFYLGFKHVVDTLNTNDFKVNLELFDMDDKDSLNLAAILDHLNKKQTDFIIGPMYANGFKTVSQKAKELNIPIVSPITQQNKFLYNNIYASKTNPSQYTLLESLADYIIDSLKPKKVRVILNISNEKDQKETGFAKAFRTYFNNKIKSTAYGIKDSVITCKGIDGIKKNYADGMKNVVVNFSSNQVLITDFTTQLALFGNKKDITLCGWQSTSSIENIDQEYLNQLNYTYPSSNHLTNLKAYDPLLYKYRAVQNTYPSEFYFIGYDIAWYYLNHLKTYGPEFIFKLNELPSEGKYIRFKFTRPDNTTGFDNNGVYIFRYNNYQLTETGWK